MKNITISVPEEVYRQARIRAAEAGTSVSALVSEFLQSLLNRDHRFSELASKQKRIQKQIRSFSADNRLPRDLVHSREVR